MRALLFAALFALLVQSALCAKYTETITAGCSSKSCSPKLSIHGGVGWSGPAQTANICAGKPENSLVVNDQAELVLCLTDLSTGVFGPYQLTGARNSPDYLLTTASYPNKGGCQYATYTDDRDLTNQQLKNRILQLENLWDNFDEICEKEYGSDYVAATPVDAMFALKGTAAPLDIDLSFPALGTDGVYNVRGGYFFWYQANGQQIVNDARWALFPVYSDCYGGEASSRTTTLPVNPESGDLTICFNKQNNDSPDNPMGGSINGDLDLPGWEGAWGPVLCRRRDLNIQSVAVPGPSLHEINKKNAPKPDCSSLFGAQYTAITARELSQRITAPMSQGAYSEYLFPQFGISTSDADANGYLFMPYSKDYDSSKLTIRTSSDGTLCDFSTVKLTCSRNVNTLSPPP